MKFQCDIHRIAKFFADEPQRLDSAAHLIRRNVLASRLVGDAVEWPDLHGADSTLEQFPRQANRLGHEVDPIVAGVVGSDRLPRRAAEELVDRRAGRLTGQIPQSDVDGPDGAHPGAGPAAVGDGLEHVGPEPVDRQRIAAQQDRGRDPLSIDRLWADMFQAISYSGWAGARMRAIRAIDIALGDLAGKAAGAPVYQLLGGASRESIRTYNTCYDRVDFMTEPVRLARELLESGIRAMKIWPFDGVAHETGGQYITPDQMSRGIEPVRLIREDVAA